MKQVTLTQSALTRKIKKKIHKAFGMEVSVVMRERGNLERLVTANPFKGIRVTPRTRLFVTFLAERPRRKAMLVP